MWPSMLGALPGGAHCLAQLLLLQPQAVGVLWVVLKPIGCAAGLSKCWGCMYRLVYAGCNTHHAGRKAGAANTCDPLLTSTFSQ